MCINIFVEKVFLNTSVDGTPANEKADPVVTKNKLKIIVFNVDKQGWAGQGKAYTDRNTGE